MRNSSLVGQLRTLAATASLALAATVAPLSGASGYTYKVLYDFCSQAYCADGKLPEAGLTMDSSGNLYGSTPYGGSSKHRNGTIFELVKNGGTYTYRVLYNFCTRVRCLDSDHPVGPLIADSSGSLYGIATDGGAHNKGSAFMLKPNRKRTKWKFKTLHGFCSDFDGVRCLDGYSPSGLTYQGAEFGIPYDGQSALYGVTYYGGTGGSDRGAGVAFQFTGAQHEFKIIYNFCPDQSDCADAIPYGLVVDSNGVLFGAAGSGAIYELSPLGSSYSHALLYQPCPPGDCANGYGNTLLTVRADGSLVGSTEGGGSCGYGTVFKLVPNTLSSQYAVLWNFCNPVEGGRYPEGKVLVGANGNFFGTVS